MRAVVHGMLTICFAASDNAACCLPLMLSVEMFMELSITSALVTSHKR
jgi:hypothetical protein